MISLSRTHASGMVKEIEVERGNTRGLIMNSSPFNCYNDKLIPSTGQHGANISEQRIDELDHACLDFVRARKETGHSLQAIDMGGGSGA